MPAAPIIRIRAQREDNDCAIVALAMYLDVSYEDVLRAATLADRQQGRKGLWTRTMIRVAKRLGHTLVVKETFDMEDAKGILRLPDHAAVLWDGLIINTDETIWPADAFLAVRKCLPRDCLLLVAED